MDAAKPSSGSPPLPDRQAGPLPPTPPRFSGPVVPPPPAPRPKVLPPAPLRDIKPTVTPPLKPVQPTPAPKRAEVVPSFVSTVSPPPSTPSPVSTNTEIRTMRDDLAAVRTTPRAAATAARTVSAPSTFPLPPVPSGGQKVTTPPLRYRRPGRWWRRLIWIGLIALACAAGYYTWIFFQPPQPLSEVLISEASAILPQKTAFIAQYNLLTPRNREAMAAAWNKTGKPASMTSLLTGDPRLLLTDPDINQFFYVLLEHDPRLYVVAPVTTHLTKLVSDTYDAAVAKHEGWYILHQLNTDTYLSVLREGSWQQQEQAVALKIDENGSPLRLILGSGSLAEIRRNLAGETLSAGTLTTVIVDGNIDPGANVLRLQGSALVAGGLIGSTAADGSMLNRIPADTSGAVAGSNFSESVSQWKKINSGKATDRLSKAAVAALLSQLSGPFTFYTRLGTDHIRDVGLLISLPPEVAKNVRLGDPTLEDAIQALVPLLLPTEQFPPSLAFTPVNYGATPLRYTNLSGSTVALDYAVTSTHLLIATSKEGITKLIDTIEGRLPTLSQTPSWQEVLGVLTSLPTAHDIIIGSIDYPPLQQVLFNAEGNPLPFAITIATDPAGPRVAGSIGLPPPTP